MYPYLNEQLLYCNVISFLISTDLQLKPYRTDEFIHKLFYETSRFTVFSNQWAVKARLNDTQTDPTQSCERTLSYQVRPPFMLNFYS